MLLGQPLYQPCRGSSASACTARCRAAPRRPTSSSSSASCCARTASWARSWSSPATVWPRWPWPTGPRSPTWPRVRGDHDGHLPDRRRDARLPAPHGPGHGARSTSSSATPGAGPVAAARRGAPTSTRRWSSTSARSAQPGRPPPAPGPGAAAATCGQLRAPPTRRPIGDGRGPRRCGRRRRRPQRARWPSRPSRAARTPPTRASWSGPGCWPATRWRAGSACRHRQDQPRPGLAGGDRYLSGPASRRRSRRSASTWSATAARPASATRAPGRGRSPSRSRKRAWWWPPSSRATATSRAASTRSPGPRYLASPPLVVAFALAGRVDIDLDVRAARRSASDGAPVMLADIWPSGRRDPGAPSPGRSTASCSGRPTPRSSRATSAGAPCPSPRATATRWDAASTYVASPPFFAGTGPRARPP